MKLRNILLTLFLSYFLSSQAFSQSKVDVEIAFLIDTSGSIDDSVLKDQREAIRNAFKSPRVIRAIQDNFNQKISVAYFEFSDSPTMASDWKIIQRKQDIDNWINSVPEERSQRGLTETGPGLKFAIDSIFSNGIDSYVQVVLILTDAIADNKNHTNGLLKNLYLSSPDSLSVSAIMMPMHEFNREKVYEWAEKHVVNGSKRYIMNFSYENIEIMLVKLIEMETQ